MGYWTGPAFCKSCNTIGNLQQSKSGQIFCRLCKEFNQSGDFMDLPPDERGKIYSRTSLFDGWSLMKSEFTPAHISRRPFMREGEKEPNDHYRPWLENHVGKQGKTGIGIYHRMIIEFW